MLEFDDRKSYSLFVVKRIILICFIFASLFPSLCIAAPLAIPKAHKICIADADCKGIRKGCSVADAVNSKFFEKYDAWRLQCSTMKFRSSSENKKVTCIDGQCQLWSDPK